MNKQIGLMISQFTDINIVRFQYQFGLAPFWGIKRKKILEKGILYEYYDTKKFLTMGLAIKLGFKIVPIRYLDLQANLNLGTEYIVYMPMFSVEIGNLRKKLNKS